MSRNSIFVSTLLLLAFRIHGFGQIPSISSGRGGRMPCGACNAPREIPFSGTIAPTSEPGERLIISGRVFQADGRTPAPGITLFLYHTDDRGHYNNRDDPYQPRLHGWVRTDSSGRYEFNTVKPAPYPGRKSPAHIHVHIFGPNLRERFIPEFNFQGDPLLSAEQDSLPSNLGSFSPVVPLTRGSDGTWRGTRDIRLEAPAPR